MMVYRTVKIGVEELSSLRKKLEGFVDRQTYEAEAISYGFIYLGNILLGNTSEIPQIQKKLLEFNDRSTYKSDAIAHGFVFLGNILSGNIEHRFSQ